MDKYYSIKEVSEKIGLPSSTIRYYEKEGVIKSIYRDKNGVRKFKESEIGLLSFIAKLKEMEMPISEMKKYVELGLDGNPTLKLRMAILLEHKKYLYEKIKKLNYDMNLLDNKINYYKEAIKNYEK